MGKGGDNSVVAVAAPVAVGKNEQKEEENEYHNDFIWSDQDEPHASRRMAILKKYPQIKQLYGHDPVLKYKIAAAMVLQLSLAYLFRHQFFPGVEQSPSQQQPQHKQYPLWLFLTVTWTIGGTCNHMMFMAFHELSHNLGFKQPKHNRWYAMFVANLPIGIPAAISFKRYHMDHHKYQGVDGIDVDIPTAVEGRIFNNCITKFLFVFFQLAFYAIRPMLVNPKPPGVDELINAVVVIVADFFVVLYWGPGALVYLLLSTLLGGGLHPVAGHFIAEHFVFPEDRRAGNVETYSYYGITNLLTFNVGYHNEHHDFPFVPGSRLPQVRQIAKEFYDPLPYHTSYVYVLYSYIFNPHITAFSRIKRHQTADDEGAVETDPIKSKSE